MLAKLGEKSALALLLALYLGFGVAFNARMAPGNAPDEPAHAFYVETLLRTGRPPVWDWPREPRSYEAVQPPLYYAAAALWDLPARRAPAALRIRWLRSFSTLLHLLALICIWRLARECGGPGMALASAAAAALLPMFIFIGAQISNDPLANLCGAFLLMTWLGPATRPSAGAREALGLGMAAGLAVNAKATLAGLAIFALAERAWAWRRERGTAAMLRNGAAALAPLLALGGPILARDLALHGGPWGLSRTFIYDAQGFGWSRLALWARLFFESFWGRFGWMTSPLPGWAYGALLALSLLAAAGAAMDWRRLLKGRGARLMAALGIALAQNFIYGFLWTSQPQARYSFVALGAWTILFCWGLRFWLERLPDWTRRPAVIAAVAAGIGLDLLALGRL